MSFVISMLFVNREKSSGSFVRSGGSHDAGRGPFAKANGPLPAMVGQILPFYILERFTFEKVTIL